MIITYFGKEYFKISQGDLVIAINPPEKSAKAPRFGADIMLSSARHADYYGVETVTFSGKEPFVIDGPGDYEVRSLFFKGATSEIIIEGKKYINTVYGFELDGIKIAFLGALEDESAMSAEAKQLAAAADVLFIPIGGGNLFDPSTAYKVAVSFDPSIIIPMEYDADTLKRFLKEGSQEKNEIVDKLTLKRKDLEGKESFIIPLESLG